MNGVTLASLAEKQKEMAAKELSMGLFHVDNK